jgi:hypothetical protein
MNESKYRYEIDADLALRIWENDAEAPFLLQPFNPDNNNGPWANNEEVVQYAQKIIGEMELNAQRLAEDPDYYKKQMDQLLQTQQAEGKTPEDYGFPTSTNFKPVFSKEQEMLIEQAREDSERIKRIEEIVTQLLKEQA